MDDSESGMNNSLEKGMPAETNQECLHKYTKAPDGSFVCRKCGLSISSSCIPLPRPSKYCPKCGEELDAGNVVCGSCGAPIDKLINRMVLIRNIDRRKCRHEYRYIEDGKICIICGKTVPLKTAAERRKYARALGKNICIFCGAPQVDGKDYCPKCTKKYEVITPLVPDGAIYDPSEASRYLKEERRPSSRPRQPGALRGSTTAAVPVAHNRPGTVQAGYRVPSPASSETNTTDESVCPNCGENAPSSHRCCEKCGSPLTQTRSLTPKAYVPPIEKIEIWKGWFFGTKAGKGVIAGIVFVVVGIILIVVGLSPFLFMSEEEKEFLDRQIAEEEAAYREGIEYGLSEHQARSNAILMTAKTNPYYDESDDDYVFLAPVGFVILIVGGILLLFSIIADQQRIREQLRMMGWGSVKRGPRDIAFKDRSSHGRQ